VGVVAVVVFRMNRILEDSDGSDDDSDLSDDFHEIKN